MTHPKLTPTTTDPTIASDAGVPPTCSNCPYWKRGFRQSISETPFYEWKTDRQFYSGPEGFGEKQVIQIEFGDCRRHAARSVTFEGGSVFGYVHQDDWCGDHPAFPAALARATQQGADDAGRSGGVTCG